MTLILLLIYLSFGVGFVVITAHQQPHLFTVGKKGIALFMMVICLLFWPGILFSGAVITSIEKSHPSHEDK